MIIEAKEVKFAYVSEEGLYNFALNGVDIAVREGEFVVILGHNGSGKSTFAKLINALNRPTEGEMTVAGIDVKDEDNAIAVRRNVGMVFQNPDNQLVATVVDEDVAFGPENLGVPPPEIVERVDRALAQVKMEKYRKRAAHAFRRTKAAHCNCRRTGYGAENHGFDESTAMLDPIGRKEVMDIIRTLHREKGMTIILITHFMEEAVDADKAIVMNGGFVLAEGRPEEILADKELLKEASLLPPPAIEMGEELKKRGVRGGGNAHDDRRVGGHHMPIEIENLKYTYMPGTPFESVALHDVSLTIEDGEFVGIIGHTAVESRH